MRNERVELPGPNFLFLRRDVIEGIPIRITHLHLARVLFINQNYSIIEMIAVFLFHLAIVILLNTTVEIYK